MIIGPFLDHKNIIGGDTVKNTILANKLKEMGYTLKIFNTTFNWRKNKVKTSLKLFWQIYMYHPSYIILSVSSGGAIAFLRGANFLKKIFHFKLLYLVVGGHIGEIANNNLKFKKLLNYCDKIYVQTLGLKREINHAGINHVIYLPNFRVFNFTPSLTKKISLPLKIVFFSRVHPEKGIELAVNSVKSINNKIGKKVLVLDIYGPIKKGYELDFKRLLRTSKNIKYQGVINVFTDETHNILSGYDLMIFPTYHYGEGLPGALIDSIMSGLPVLASDWKYNSEIIRDKITGRLFETNNLPDLIEKLEWFIKNKEKIYEMKKKCLKEREKYNANSIIPKLLALSGISKQYLP